MADSQSAEGASSEKASPVAAVETKTPETMEIEPEKTVSENQEDSTLVPMDTTESSGDLSKPDHKMEEEKSAFTSNREKMLLTGQAQASVEIPKTTESVEKPEGNMNEPNTRMEDSEVSAHSGAEKEPMSEEKADAKSELMAAGDGTSLFSLESGLKNKEQQSAKLQGQVFGTAKPSCQGDSATTAQKLFKKEMETQDTTENVSSAAKPDHSDSATTHQEPTQVRT